MSQHVQDGSQLQGNYTINLRVGLDAGHWALTAFVKNLTKEKYLEEVIPAPEFGGSFIAPGALRTWGMELTAKF